MNENEKPEQKPGQLFANRMNQIPRSFIREMLKNAASKDVISFAGGLPDEKLIPTEQLSKAFQNAVSKYGDKLFQYANSEGFLPLRQWIADRYREKFDMNFTVDEILITNGSQQAFDLIGKVFIEKGDRVLIEQPGYLGVIQSLLNFEPSLVPVPLENDGMSLSDLERALVDQNTKLMHLVPNFQNPSGISYSRLKREKIGELTKKNQAILVEDDPYGELFFEEENNRDPIKKIVGDYGILLGSFSKTLSPGMRLGWLVASREIMEKIVIAKQSSDLHTNNLSQQMAYEFLISNDYEQHLNVIRNCYRERRDLMAKAIERHFSEDIKVRIPNGGMFFWGELPDHISSWKLMNLCLDAGVVFVPGEVFYTENKRENTFRLNFSKSTPEEIENGIKIIAKAIAFLNSKNKVYQSV